MRFRLATIDDVPDLTKLYTDYVANEPPLYPKPGDPETCAKEWATAQIINLATNPNYFCIVGVVGSKLDGERVVGGKVKAMITVFLSQRAIGFPKVVAFCEMLLVDPKFRGRETAKKIVIIACRYSQLKGAEVFEAAWRSGSSVGESWKRVGMKPYQEYGAFILDDGTPKPGLIWSDSDLISNPDRARIKTEKESPSHG